MQSQLSCLASNHFVSWLTYGHLQLTSHYMSHTSYHGWRHEPAQPCPLHSRVHRMALRTKHNNEIQWSLKGARTVWCRFWEAHDPGLSIKQQVGYEIVHATDGFVLWLPHRCNKCLSNAVVMDSNAKLFCLAHESFPTRNSWRQAGQRNDDSGEKEET